MCVYCPGETQDPLCRRCAMCPRHCQCRGLNTEDYTRRVVDMTRKACETPNTRWLRNLNIGGDE